MTKKEIRQKYCNKKNYTSWNKYNITEYSKWLENEKNAFWMESPYKKGISKNWMGTKRIR